MLGVAVRWYAGDRAFGILSTGDELLPVEAPLTPGKIHRCQFLTLTGLVEQAGGQPKAWGIAAPVEAVREALGARHPGRCGFNPDLCRGERGAAGFVRSVVEMDGRLDFGGSICARASRWPSVITARRLSSAAGTRFQPMSVFEVFVRPLC